jgi:hypothetical protein
MLYKFLRNIHTILGMLLFWVILMYGASAVQMAHRVRIVPVVVERDQTLEPGLEARAVAAKLDIGGEMGNVTQQPAGFRFPMNRAGGNSQITYDRTTGKVHIREQQTGMLGVLNRLHHFHGLHNRTGARNAWGWTVFFASLAMFALGLTGLYMWFRLYKERAIGSVLLAANLVISVALLVALRA